MPPNERALGRSLSTALSERTSLVAFVAIAVVVVSAGVVASLGRSSGGGGFVLSEELTSVPIDPLGPEVSSEALNVKNFSTTAGDDAAAVSIAAGAESESSTTAQSDSESTGVAVDSSDATTVTTALKAQSAASSTSLTGNTTKSTGQSTVPSSRVSSTVPSSTVPSSRVSSTVPGQGAAYYVDCAAGSDSNDGRSASRALRSLNRANTLQLRPADRLLLKRGCSWSGGQRLNASWHGTSSDPITIGAYGSGNKPRIVDGRNQGVKVTGSHMVIENLHITFGVAATKTLNGCDQPFGDYYGVNFTGGAHHVRLIGSLMERANAGVHISAASSSITVQGNVLKNNNVMNVFGGDPAVDLGAWGVLLRSDNNDVSYNEFANNRAPCANGAGRIHSNSVEIFEGKQNYIHHNRSNDRVFSELGGSSTEKAADNRFEFNLHSTSMVDARFVTTRGGGSGWGPVYRTTVEHNTVNLTGAGSVAISCGNGCSGNILRLRGNILIGADKPLFADANFDEADNVYWHPTGATRIQIAGVNKLHAPGTLILNGSIVADPLLNNSSRPSGSSPAVNRADSSAPKAGADLAGNSPVGARDSGAFEVG